MTNINTLQFNFSTKLSKEDLEYLRKELKILSKR